MCSCSTCCEIAGKAWNGAQEGKFTRRRKVTGSLTGYSLQLKELLGGEFGVIENRFHQTDPDDFASMNRHNRAATVGMLQEMVAALDPHNFKASTLQRGDHLAASAAGEFRHG
jgi:hypothetical protein